MVSLEPWPSDGIKNLRVIHIFLLVEQHSSSFLHHSRSWKLCDPLGDSPLCAPEVPEAAWCWPGVPRSSYFQRRRAVFCIQGEVLSYKTCTFSELSEICCCWALLSLFLLVPALSPGPPAHPQLLSPLVALPWIMRPWIMAGFKVSWESNSRKISEIFLFVYYNLQRRTGRKILKFRAMFMLKIPF